MRKEGKRKVELLLERAKVLVDHYWELGKETKTEKLKCIEKDICDCLPILWTASEDKSTGCTFLTVIDCFREKQKIELTETCAPLVATLNRFALEYDDWQKVEKYAQEKTENLVMHAMATMARRMVCDIEGKTFTVKRRLKGKMEENGPNFVIYDDRTYQSACALTSGVHFYEAVILTDREVKVGWTTRGWSESEFEPVNAEGTIRQWIDRYDGHHSIGFFGSFPIGSVLGCLLDVSQRSFTFYVNGKEVNCQQKTTFSSNAYYVEGKVNFTYLLFCTSILDKFPSSTIHLNLSTYWLNPAILTWQNKQIDMHFTSMLT